jgi:endonuclease YncB( thermonuclease family)
MRAVISALRRVISPGDLGRSFRGKATRKCQVAASLIWSEFQARMLRTTKETAVIAVFTLLALLVSTGLGVAAPIDSADIHVIDGDTIRIHHKQPDVRLVGFNAPETRRAACEAEGELGAKATRRLRELVRTTDLDFEFVPCACQPGTEGTLICNYGRRCGTLKANGRDVGAILIEEGLAVRFVCGTTRCPRTPRPWC